MNSLINYPKNNFTNTLIEATDLTQKDRTEENHRSHYNLTLVFNDYYTTSNGIDKIYFKLFYTTTVINHDHNFGLLCK